MLRTNTPSGAITPWTRVLASLLLIAIATPVLSSVYDLLSGRRPVPPLPWYAATFAVIFGIPFFMAVASVAILGREPAFWLRFLQRFSTPAQTPDVRLGGWRYPAWLRRLGLTILGGVATFHAIQIAASVSGGPLTAADLLLLLFAWALALGVVVALVRWWRAPGVKRHTDLRNGVD